jgi:hypothetical protein
LARAAKQGCKRAFDDSIPCPVIAKSLSVIALPTFGGGRHFVEKDSISRPFAAIKKTHS